MGYNSSRNSCFSLAFLMLGLAMPLGLVMSLAGTSFARSHPVKGATFKPRRLQIQLPFPCGVEVAVNCAYGPGCSPAHKRVHSKNGPNDYYALDLRRRERGNGVKKPIVAAADGIIRFAGWTRGGWSPYGKVVYIEHLYRDREGHRYQTIYAHLHSVSVKKNQYVRAGAVIGTLGGSSKGRLGWFGPHLHFAMYQDAKSTFGGGRAVFPEPIGKFRNIHRGMQLTACGQPEPDRIAFAQPLNLFSPDRSLDPRVLRLIK